jgi:hypothetical protein
LVARKAIERKGWRHSERRGLVVRLVAVALLAKLHMFEVLFSSLAAQARHQRVKGRLQRVRTAARCYGWCCRRSSSWGSGRRCRRCWCRCRSGCCSGCRSRSWCGCSRRRRRRCSITRMLARPERRAERWSVQAGGRNVVYVSVCVNACRRTSSRGSGGRWECRSAPARCGGLIQPRSSTHTGCRVSRGTSRAH